MKIRCNRCYRVLNNNEVYCTRCGEYSTQINDIMTHKAVEVEDGRNFSIQLSFYASIIFLVSGSLIVIFSVLFDRFNPDIYYGDLGALLPSYVSLFANTNALFVTSVALLLLFLMIERKNLKQIFSIPKLRLGLMISLLIIGVAFFAILTKYTDIIVIPSFYKNALTDTNYGLSYLGKSGLFKIVSSLLAYAIVQEIVIRYSGGNALDDVTLVPDFLHILLISILATILDWAGYAFNINMLLGNFILQLFLSTTYIIFKRNIFFNVVFRFVLITVIIIIL